jgi:hypothetical protein
VKYYIAVDRYRAQDTGYSDADDLLSFVKTVRVAECFGLTPETPVYGLRVKSKLRKKTTEWVELIPHVMGMCSKVMTPEKELNLTTMLTPFSCDYDNLLPRLATERLLSPFSPLQKFAEALAVASREHTLEEQALHRILKVAESRGTYTINHTIDFDEKWAEVLPQYPMLTLDVSDYNEDAQNTIIDYVAMVDERAGIVREKALAAAATSQEASNE